MNQVIWAQEIKQYGVHFKVCTEGIVEQQEDHKLMDDQLFN